MLSDNPTFLDAATFKSPKSLTPPCDDIVTYAIFEIFLQVDNQKKQVLIASIKTVFDRLDEESKRKMNLLAPDSAKKLFNF